MPTVSSSPRGSPYLLETGERYATFHRATDAARQRAKKRTSHVRWPAVAPKEGDSGSPTAAAFALLQGD
jgi:hypothetical protein